MSYYPLKYPTQSAYNNEFIASNIGPNNDSYSIISFYKHVIETDEITYTSEVVKNWVYDKKPINPVEGRKYRETLFTGTLKECYQFIDNIVNNP